MEERAAADAEGLAGGGVFDSAGGNGRHELFEPSEETGGDGAIGFENIDLDFRTVREEFEGTKKIGPLLLLDRRLNFYDGLVEKGSGDIAMADALDGVRFSLMKAARAGLEVKLDAVAVGPRLAADDRDFGGVIEAADAAQGFAQDVHFLRKLKRIAGMLKLAAAAGREVFAFRFDAFGGGIEDFNARALEQAGFHGPRRERDLFARQGKGRENDLAIEAAETIAAINQFFDLDLRRRVFFYSGHLLG